MFSRSLLQLQMLLRGTVKSMWLRFRCAVGMVHLWESEKDRLWVWNCESTYELHICLRASFYAEICMIL